MRGASPVGCGLPSGLVEGYQTSPLFLSCFTSVRTHEMVTTTRLPHQVVVSVMPHRLFRVRLCKTSNTNPPPHPPICIALRFYSNNNQKKKGNDIQPQINFPTAHRNAYSPSDLLAGGDEFEYSSNVTRARETSPIYNRGIVPSGGDVKGREDERVQLCQMNTTALSTSFCSTST